MSDNKYLIFGSYSSEFVKLVDEEEILYWKLIGNYGILSAEDINQFYQHISEHVNNEFIKNLVEYGIDSLPEEKLFVLLSVISYYISNGLYYNIDPPLFDRIQKELFWFK